MDIRENESFPRTPVPLVVVTAIVYIAGFATVAAWFALLVLGQPGPAPASRSPSSSCGVCGVVEGVAEFERTGLQLSGDPGEGFVVLLAALGGSLNSGAAPGRVYETAVLHDDGSVRIVRDSSAPQWKRGDRVRVIKGRIELGAFSAANAAAGATHAPSAAAPAALPAGRTPSPVPPVARAP